MTSAVKLLLLPLAVGLLLAGCADKEGCTDSKASNFDADAKKDNGSCTYQLTDELLNSVNTVWHTGVTGLHNGDSTLDAHNSSTGIRDIHANVALTVGSAVPGTIVVKHMYAKNNDGSKGALQKIFVMMKREDGFNDLRGNWQYWRIDAPSGFDLAAQPNGSLTNADEKGDAATLYCASCHESAQFDRLFSKDY